MLRAALRARSDLGLILARTQTRTLTRREHTAPSRPTSRTLHTHPHLVHPPHTQVEVQLPGDASFPLRLSKSITKFELKLVDKGSSAGTWKVTLGIEKSKALEHKGTVAQISCLLNAATANRLRACTIPAIPATVSANPNPNPDPNPNPNPNPNRNQVPIFEQEDETVASSNMSSGNGLLPPMRTPASAAKKPTVPAAANDPFEFEPDEAEPRSNGGKASKTATPAAGKATPKPPPKSKSTSTTKENNMRGKDVHSVPDLDDVFDFAPAEVTLPRGATG